MSSLQVLDAFRRSEPNGPVGLAIADFLRNAIVRNQLAPGQTLPEAELAQIMGVSRQPVREALIRLSEAGLLRILPQRGTRVTGISLAGVEGGRFIRQAVERAVIVQAAQRAGEAEIRRMERIVDAQVEAIREDDHAGFLRLDDALHQAFAQAAGIESAWSGLAAVKLQMDRVRYLSLPEATPVATLIAQHRAIAAAVAAHDAAAAEAAMAEHLSEVLSALPRLVARFPGHFDRGPEG
ncbi:MAG: GntR family transcriptional regulator [Methylobacterium frigidaeris]